MRREYDFSGGRRGPVVRTPRGKTRITIRLDNDVLDWFRTAVEAAGGGSYQSLINAALREHIGRAAEPPPGEAPPAQALEAVVRRVVREELQRPRAAGVGRRRGKSRGAA